jgi:hypothetical protein
MCMYTTHDFWEAEPKVSSKMLLRVQSQQKPWLSTCRCPDSMYQPQVGLDSRAPSCSSR